MSEELLDFNLPKQKNSIIKVVGVGGGGGNAVNYMFEQGIRDVDFMICNTDEQALEKSPVPVKIQLGSSLTEGRGAGNKPELGKQAAIENLEDILEVLSANTKMVFITAGMGGGTGTGAAPVIAKAARELNILTVAIVTIPFRFEGQRRINQALDGIAELKQHTDSLLVINNEKLREIFGDLKLSEAFSRADNVLSIAAKGIAEIITVHGHINVDFADVHTVMKDSGVAIMGSALAEGENRAVKAIEDALTSPLLNNNNILGAKNILLNITSGSDEIRMDEIGEISDYVQQAAGSNADIILGSCNDDSLGETVSVTVIATGFGETSIPELYTRRTTVKNNVVLKEAGQDEPAETHKRELREEPEEKPIRNTKSDTGQRTIHFETKEKPKEKKQALYEEMYGESNKDVTDKQLEDKMESFKKSYERLKDMKNYHNPDDIDELENEPAYKRKQANTRQQDEQSSSPAREEEEEEVSRFTLSEDDNKNPVLKKDNPYLHDNVD